MKKTITPQDMKNARKPIYVTFCHTSLLTGKSYYAVVCKDEDEANKTAMEAFYLPCVTQVRLRKSKLMPQSPRILIPKARNFHKHII